MRQSGWAAIAANWRRRNTLLSPFYSDSAPFRAIIARLMVAKSRRKIKRRTLQQFERHFDLARLDYPKRIAPARHKPKLNGVIAAAAVYGLFFLLGMIGVNRGAIDQQTFVKLSWIVMVPSSAVGAFVYMLISNRRQYDVVQEMRAYIGLIEKDKGLLWRYQPLIELLLPDNSLAMQAATASRDGDIARIHPEDYGNTVHALYQALLESENREIPEETESRLNQNFSRDNEDVA